MSFINIFYSVVAICLSASGAAAEESSTGCRKDSDCELAVATCGAITSVPKGERLPAFIDEDICLNIVSPESLLKNFAASCDKGTCRAKLVKR